VAQAHHRRRHPHLTQKQRRAQDEVTRGGKAALSAKTTIDQLVATSETAA
jgi:hypothetical protein